MNRSALVLAAIGVGLAVVAVARDDHRLAWVAAGALAAALILRFVARRRIQANEEADDQSEAA